MKTYSTYIFDLDGTLLDTLGDLAASVNYALQRHGMPRHSVDDIRRFVGNGVRNLVIQSVPDGEADPRFESVLAMFRDHYGRNNAVLTQPYPGITDMLVRLKAGGKNIAVVSNKFDTAVKSLCSHYFGQLIDVAIGEHEGVRRKPAPDTVNEALTLMKADRSTAVYVGDSDVDIVTATNSSLPCISVLWGFRDRDFLLAHGATTFAYTAEDIY